MHLGKSILGLTKLTAFVNSSLRGVTMVPGWAPLLTTQCAGRLRQLHRCAQEPRACLSLPLPVACDAPGFTQHRHSVLVTQKCSRVTLEPRTREFQPELLLCDVGSVTPALRQGMRSSEI